MNQLPESEYLDMHSASDVRIVGTRVGLEHLLEGYCAGAIPEQLAVEFASMSLEQIHGVIAYYLRHREAVDAYVQHCQHTSSQRQAATVGPVEVITRLRELAKQQAAG